MVKPRKNNLGLKQSEAHGNNRTCNRAHRHGRSISGISGGIIKPVMDVVCTISSARILFMSGTTTLAMVSASLIRNRDEIKRIDRGGIMLAIGAAVSGLARKATL